MPSKLPIIKANTTQKNIDKMKVIAEANKRSVAKELEWLIERHIEKYEEVNGEIEIKNPFDEVTEMLQSDIPFKEKMKKSYELGKSIGYGKDDNPQNS